jgi:hypothetical protein
MALVVFDKSGEIMCDTQGNQLVIVGATLVVALPNLQHG